MDALKESLKSEVHAVKIKTMTIDKYEIDPNTKEETFEEQVREEKNRHIGKVPIMVRSEYCFLNKISFLVLGTICVAPLKTKFKQHLV